MKSTRIHLNEAALGVTKLLTMATRKTDAELNLIIGYDDAKVLNNTVEDLVKLAEERNDVN